MTKEQISLDEINSLPLSEDEKTIISNILINDKTQTSDLEINNLTAKLQELLPSNSSNPYYKILATKATARTLGTGEYCITMTLDEALNHGELKDIPNSEKYGFVSPITKGGYALNGEVTIIQGIAYWAHLKDAEFVLEILPKTMPISFGQIIIMRDDNLNKKDEPYSTQIVSPIKDREFSGFSGITDLINDSILPTKVGAKYSASNAGMMMASFTAVLAVGSKSKVRETFEPILPNESGIYPSAGKTQQYITDIKPNNKNRILFTDFRDKISNDTDVKAPHLHFVPEAVIALVNDLIKNGKDIYDPGYRAYINRRIKNLIKKENLQIGGHITELGSGNISSQIHFQAKTSCSLIQKDKTDLVIPLTNVSKEKMAEFDLIVKIIESLNEIPRQNFLVVGLNNQHEKLKI